MTPLLAARAREAAAAIPDAVRRFAQDLARRGDVAAVLYYGATLRGGDASGVLDFYVLTDGARRTGLRGALERRLWPEIAFVRSAPQPAGPELHAKVAILPLPVFARAARGRGLDTTVWTRFVQPCVLAWVRDGEARAEVTGALAAAAVVAGRFAAVLGPARGPAEAYWSALFRQTYAAELRVEPPGRERQVLAGDPARYAALLPLCWDAAGIGWTRDGEALAPTLAPAERLRLERAWRLRRRLGKPLNAARLLKAALTTAGAARYAAGKLARHTGLRVEVTPWRERHPVLAGLAVLWRLRRRQADAR